MTRRRGARATAQATATALALLLAGAGPALAADPPPQPRAGSVPTDQSGRIPAVSETQDQIRATAAIGRDVRDAAGTKLATIADLLLNRQTGAVELAILKPAAGVTIRNGGATVAWNALRYEARPTPRFVTALTRDDLASGASFKDEAKASGLYYDAADELLGKPAVAPDGAQLGKITDFVLNFGTGGLVALIVDTSGPVSLHRINYHAIPWDRAKPQGGKGRDPVHLALTAAEIAAMPVVVTRAPEAPGSTGSADTSRGVVTPDAAGNISGTSIPAPATRRK